LNHAIFSVDAGHRAVVFNQFSGVIEKEYNEGTWLKWPVIETPHAIDIRAKPYEITTLTGTKDLQTVNITIRVLSRPEAEKVVTIYRTLGMNFNERVLPSIGNEILKAVVAKYNAEELLSKRQTISDLIRQDLEKRAKKFNLFLDDVSITHCVFTKEFVGAIEQKQVAEQDAERENWIVAKADQEKQAQIILSTGEAEAAKVISKALSESGTGLIEMKRIDTAREVAGVLARSRNITYLPGGNSGGGSNLLLGLNTGS